MNAVFSARCAKVFSQTQYIYIDENTPEGHLEPAASIKRQVCPSTQSRIQTRKPKEAETHCNAPASVFSLFVNSVLYRPSLVEPFTPVTHRGLLPLYAVLRHWDQTPISELVVPARPTTPSSNAVTPRAAAGTHMSHRSETSCTRAAERSLHKQLN